MDKRYALTFLVLRLFTLVAAVVGLTGLTTQALVDSPWKPLEPECDNGLTKRIP